MPSRKRHFQGEPQQMQRSPADPVHGSNEFPFSGRRSAFETPHIQAAFHNNRNPSSSSMRRDIHSGDQDKSSSTVPSYTSTKRAKQEGEERIKPKSKSSKVLQEDEADDAQPTPKEKKNRSSSIFNGEDRLVIDFESFGKLSDCPQKMGRREGFIPDGVCGSFSMYGEPWQFSIDHERKARIGDSEVICIRWTITNKTSKISHSILETAAEARKREQRGVSLCNRVFTEAMDIRARQYEEMIEEEKQGQPPNLLHISNLRSRALSLRPHRFAEGPLLFGLRHKCVQNALNAFATGPHS